MKTEELTKNWIRAEQHLESCRQQVIRAECELSNVKNELGKHLAPSDMTPNETIGVWVNGKCVGLRDDIFVQVRRIDANTYKLERRTRK